MTKVNVISGGKSAEREVSLRSGVAVAKALASSGHEVTLLDPRIADIEEIAACDIVFLALHGAGGEDGTIQAKLEARGTKFVGSGSAASALCFDKSQYKRLLQEKGLPTPRFALIHEWDVQDHELTKRPFVIKPYDGGSSIDTFIVRQPEKAPWAQILNAIKGTYGEMLLEELIEGTELTVGILGDKPLPIIKIVPPQHGEFDYENKYNGASQEIIAPDDIPARVQATAQNLALKAHTLAGCRDLSRTDIMLNSRGDLYLLETNTLPGMTDQSLFPKMAAADGMLMPELCQRLVAMALNGS